MTDAAARFAQVKALFDACADRPEAEREALIAAAALPADALAELRSLLAHHAAAGETGSFMSPSAAAAVAKAAVGDGPSARDAPRDDATTVRPGQRLGNWALVRAVGEGGMGQVFEARRADGQYEGRAAVKLLKRGMDSAAVLRRFALERQALARLSHPHIARLLDAGASEQGLPYFVLEFVDGRPIDVAARALPVDARLRLFLQLADAVAHAHRNLLVHRDLKPGNVLVDGDGQVKLLDFGIAKALDPLEGGADGADGSTEGGTTIGGPRPYTPHYASPEQVRGEPVSTATDIYSLGVLLYQMLTGTRPTGRRATTPAEAARGVLEDAPTRPSRLSPSEAVDPQWLQTRRRLEGDLDNILLKALQKAPAERYSSVEALAADVRACLEGRPVSARAATPAYVLGRFVRRHRWAVAAGALGGLGLATGLAAALLQGRVAAAVGALGLALGLGIALLKARQAEVARARSDAHVRDLRQIARDVVLEYGDAITFVPGGMQRKAAMLQATLGHLDRLADVARDDPAFSGELAHLYARLANLRTTGEFNAAENTPEAEQQARRAIALFTVAEAAGSTDANASLWWSKALGVCAKAAQQRGDLPQALRHLHEADAVLQRGLRRHPGATALRSARADTLMLVVQVHFGWGRPHLGQPEEALARLDEARGLYAQLAADAATEAAPDAQAGAGAPAVQDVFQLGTVASTRALVLARLERWAEAIAAAHEAVAQRSRACALAPHNRVMQGGVAADRNLLGGLCLNAGDAAAALDATRRAWVALDGLQADDPDNQTWQNQRRFLAFNHGRALLGCGQAAAALPVLQQVLEWLQPLVTAGQASSLQRRRLAQAQLARAQALVALEGGPLAGPVQLARQAAAEFDRLAQAEPADRDHALALGECASALAGWGDAAGPPPAPAQGWAGVARDAYTQAHALQPLTALHACRALQVGVVGVAEVAVASASAQGPR